MTGRILRFCETGLTNLGTKFWKYPIPSMSIINKDKPTEVCVNCQGCTFYEGFKQNQEAFLNVNLFDKICSLVRRR